MNKDIKSLYIHIPFCEKICDYCDFTKLQYFRIFATKYLKALKTELDSYQINNDLETIYIGGGTPTALDDDLFEELLNLIDPYFKDGIEYTIEANPESLTIEKLKLMKKHNVNRISIGVESTDDKILKAINRSHTFKQVQDAIKFAKELGFNNINVDLILGLPNVNKNMLIKDIKNILSLDVQHISCYSLSIHPNTVFYLKGLKENDSDIEREYYDSINEILTENGFIHYEISNWSKPGKESKHNFTYWKNNQYYGIGLGASGYIGNLRYTNTKNLDSYCQGKFIDYKEKVSKKDEIEYAIMLNLRTNQGINLNEFKSRYDYDLLKFKKVEIEGLINLGYLEFNKVKNSIIPTYKGMMTLDQIILKLFD